MAGLTGGGSLAILAAMPDTEIDHVFAQNADALARLYPTYSPDLLRQCVAEFGPLRGLYTRMAFELFDAGRCPPDQVRIAALAVDDTQRGRGVG